MISKNEYWYYSVELTPGEFSPGGNYPNVVTTRELLSRMDPAGAKAIDIGTMEALVPILLSRRGAQVTALDALDFSKKITMLRNVYGVEFDYHPRVSLGNAKKFLTDKNIFEGFLKPKSPDRGYDLMVCSGMLYHVFSPLETLGLCRSLLKKGGLLVLETAASTLPEYSMRWNFDGQRWIYPNGTNTWFPTLKLFDHFLRFLRFRVVDCTFIKDHADIVRVAVVVEAVDDLLIKNSEEEWFAASTRNFDYESFCDLEWAQGDARKLPYTPGATIKHEDVDSVDIHRVVTETPELETPLDRIRLHLTDQS